MTRPDPTTATRRAASLWLSVIAGVVVVSCVLPVRNTRVSLRVNIAADANERTPVPVDLVFVWDETLAGQLMKLPAKEWFAMKAQFLQDDPGGKLLTVCQWEWVPRQHVPDFNVIVPAAARLWVQGVFVFANYRIEGVHRSRLVPGAAAVLDLGRDGMSLRTTGTAASPAYAILGEVDVCQPRRAQPSSR